MSSQSSDDIMSCGVCSQDSNANVAPSCSENTPFLQLASLCLTDHHDENFLRWRPQADSDCDSDADTTNGKRKQRSQAPKTDVQQKNSKMDEEMQCEEENSESQVQSEKSDTYVDCEADNEEEEDLESMEECSVVFTSIIQSSTLGMKRKNSDQLESPTPAKVKRSNSI